MSKLRGVNYPLWEITKVKEDEDEIHRKIQYIKLVNIVSKSMLNDSVMSERIFVPHIWWEVSGVLHNHICRLIVVSKKYHQ